MLVKLESCPIQKDTQIVFDSNANEPQMRPIEYGWNRWHFDECYEHQNERFQHRECLTAARAC